MKKPEQHIFFEGINALRFFAALAVIITHIELIKNFYSLGNSWQNTIVFNLGSLGVYFFFVLSGFLITYLLLVEKQKTNSISIKKFYWRRLLRIWPLYYLIVVIGFFILPYFNVFQIPYLYDQFQKHFGFNLILYILILPNLAFSIYPSVPNIGQTWSIGVEEQFYLVWPWIIKKSKNILKTLIIIFLIIVASKFFVLCLGLFFSSERWYQILKLFLAMSKFECMAIGGIGAYHLFNNHQLLAYLNKRWISFAAIGMVFLLLFFIPSFLQDGIHIVMGLLFLLVILNVLLTKPKWLSTKWLDYLGRISYGLYMYHFMMIPLMLYFIKPFFEFSNSIFFNSLLYVSVILSTVIVASISYYLFELKFVRLKEKFTVVSSGTV